MYSTYVPCCAVAKELYRRHYTVSSFNTYDSPPKILLLYVPTYMEGHGAC